MRSTETHALALLGGISAAQFMRRHWQKSWRLIRGAIPGFDGVIDRKSLFALAARDDVESRLIVRGASRRDWTLEHGPFRASDLRKLPRTGWTLLVQGVDLHVDAAHELLQRFSFIPHARLDDLMISYAVEGGGVGPHFDSYDVFLLQGQGVRRWQISEQDDLRLQPGAPLKILSHFKPSQSWDLGPGDMLYLPPSVAHDGVASTECMTYSIGFRAPTEREIVDAFLQFIPERLDVADARHADPDLSATTHPGEIGAAMQKRLAQSLRAIRWTPAMVSDFIGCMLSEPKSGVYLDRPDPALSYERFVRAAIRSGLRLDRRSRMLYDRSRVFLNGETFASLSDHPAFAELSDRRSIDGANLPRPSMALLHNAYLNGAIHVGRIGAS